MESSSYRQSVLCTGALLSSEAGRPALDGMPLHKAHQIDMPQMLPEQGRCQGRRQSARCILAPAEIQGHP